MILSARLVYLLQGLDSRLHRVHARYPRLLPLRLVRVVCDAYEARLLATGNGPSVTDEEIAAGRTTYYETEAAFLAALDRVPPAEALPGT